MVNFREACSDFEVMQEANLVFWILKQQLDRTGCVAHGVKTHSPKTVRTTLACFHSFCSLPARSRSSNSTMAPKNAPSGEKKPAVAKKSVAKKSTAGKKKGGSKKAVESYKIYIYKVG